jgi:hypothetical protein
MKCEASTYGFLAFNAHHHTEKCQRREEPVFVLSVRLRFASIAADPGPSPRNSNNLKPTRALSSNFQLSIVPSSFNLSLPATL